MLVGLCTLRLFFPGAQSLKDKRQVLKGILDRARTRLNIAVAEVGFQDLWQRGEVAFAAVGCDQAVVHSVLMSAVRMAESEPRVEVLDVAIEWR